MSGSSSADAPKKKTTRTRATRAAVKEKNTKAATRGGVGRTPTKHTPKKAAAAKKTSEPTVHPLDKAVTPTVESSVVDEKRRAPTPFSSEKVRKNRIRNRWIVVGVVMILGVGSSAAVGYTDTGYIDINERILSQYSPEERASRNIPVQNTNPERKVDGGLRGLGTGGGDQERRAAANAAAARASSTQESASSTATTTAATTEQTATSTPAVNEETAPVSEQEERIPPSDGATTTESIS